MSQASLSEDPSWLKDYSTKTQAFFRDLLNIHNRRENGTIEVPASVEMLREVCDNLHKIDQELTNLAQENQKLHRQTQGKVSSFMKSWKNIFSYGKSEFDKET